MLQRHITPEQALTRLQHLCVKCERCAYDMRRKAIQWGLPSDVADKLVDRLIDERFVDDERYAHAFVRDKYRFQRWGRRKISLELSRRRISSDIIALALEEIDEDDYLGYAFDLLQAKARSLGDTATTREGRLKLYRFGLMRGFESDLVIKLIRQLLSA